MACPVCHASISPLAGQAFSLVLYTLVGLASTALVLSIAVPQVCMRSCAPD